MAIYIATADLCHDHPDDPAPSKLPQDWAGKMFEMKHEASGVVYLCSWEESPFKSWHIYGDLARTISLRNPVTNIPLSVHQRVIEEKDAKIEELREKNMEFQREHRACKDNMFLVTGLRAENADQMSVIYRKDLEIEELQRKVRTQESTLDLLDGLRDAKDQELSDYKSKVAEVAAEYAAILHGMDS